ncbi:MAG: DNA-binding protein WhiA [Bacilli bacterium]
MSFSSEVKKEVLTINDTSICCKKALLLGILQGASEIIIGNNEIRILIKLPILNAVKIIIPLLKDIYKIELDEGISKSISSLGHKYYCLEVKDKVNEIIKDFSLMPYDEISIEHPVLKKDCCKAAFVRGLFVIKGSINDPRKNRYHFEINCKKESVAQTLLSIFEGIEVETKTVLKGQNYVVYVKKSEEIRDCLALIGASSGIFYFEDSRIYRDYVNQVNRLTNCDVANARRSAESCEKQLAVIQIIRDSGYFHKMPIRLQTVAKMREEYPDSTLDELVEVSDKVFGKTMSKSGISHCFRDLMSYYESLKLNKK